MPAQNSPNLLPSAEIDYVITTANTTITSTADGASGGTALIDGNPIAFDGATRICIEVFCPLLFINPATASHGVYVNLYDGTTDLGRFGELRGDVVGQSQTQIMLARFFLTPSAGVHTFHIRGWKDAAGDTGAFVCGAGGSGTLMPGYYRITKA